ncbi:MAG TPA: tetraacyldisaccharide 4'-kinase [Sedimentisphaerales bacterium]|nr:tetraacyldisaccharide 4'-kinase [Sedimentisphaerales bacterium]HRS11970.1 tetraacyldisaccharide 4'-kinase [Sedimentisphaerales bacterium]HRV49026.1 tetraacyldisaccharide 4'-kinase [Sedimentisphaerales bacterium]
MPLDQDQFRAIVSGRRRDLLAQVLKFALGPASVGYRLAVGVRNSLYDHQMLSMHRVSVPVLCVGNLTTGGTGKTPLVVWLARLMSQKGLRAAILTRGYKARRACTAHHDTKVGNAHPATDEPAELAAACPGVPVIVNPDRIAGAAEAIRNHGAQVLLMDDGFQHRRLGRNLDIVTIDATCPFGYGRLLPAGLLREPVSGLTRAHAVVLTRSDQVSEETLRRIETQIRRIDPDLLVARSIHAPVGARRSDGVEIPPDELKGKKVFAFCGLANPTAFFTTAKACGCVLAGSQTYDDHYAYAQRDLADLCQAARSYGAELLLTTQKDWTKIASLSRPDDAVPTAYLAVELRFTAGGDMLMALIEQTLAGTIPAL